MRALDGKATGGLLRNTVYYLAAIIATAVAVVAATMSPLVTIGGMGALALVLVGWKAPKLALWLWLIVGVTVPYWLALPVGIVIPPLTALTIPLVLGLLLGVRQWFLTGVDWLVIGLMATAAIAVSAGTDPASAKDVILVWGSAYVAGRIFMLRLPSAYFPRAYVIIGVLVSIWSIAEFAFRLHLFEGIFGSVASINFWNEIQTRGAFDRSEAAFGHSIALAAFLVTVIPFALRGKRPILGWAVLTVGIVATLSRAGFIGVAAAVVLCLVAYGMNRKLFLISLLGAVGALAFARDILFGVDDMAAQQIGWSTSYRLYLWQSGFAEINWIGTSGAYFRSVDQAYLRVGLDLGWLPLVLFSILSLIPVLRVVFRRTKEPAEVALAASFPILLTVALLLQWQSFLWLLAGVAVTRAHSRKTAELGSDKDDLVLPSPARREMVPRR